MMKIWEITMTDNLLVWDLMREAWSALASFYRPVIEEACREANLNSRTWGLLLAVYTFEPDEVTPGHLMVRSPYTSTDIYLNRLESAAAQNLLEEVAPGKFRLTAKGRAKALDIANLGREAMAAIDPLPLEESLRLAEWLDRLVQASLNSPPPPDPWSIRLSVRLMPEKQPPMPFIEQAFSALEAYRDDSHLAAWQLTGLSATAFEALTLLWRGEANSLAELCKQLVYRGHTCQVYQHALEDLRERGFLNGTDDSPWLTGAGRVFRNQVEDDTNRFFFKPWNCLTGEEINELALLLANLKEGLARVEAQ